MGENVVGGKTREIEPNPVRQETKTRRRQLVAALPHQHGVQPLFERMQIEHVGGSVGNLRVGEFRRTPIRQLQLLRQVVPQNLANQVLEAVLVGVGAGEPRGDLGAIDRFRHPAKGIAKHGKVETGEVKNLEQPRIG